MSAHETAITIGIPAYKRPGYTRAAIESCLNQAYSNYDIIVQDDSPEGELAGLLDGLSTRNISYEHNPVGLGLARNSNAILAKARGTWMLFLANDDRLEPGYLAALNALILKHPDAAVIRTRYQRIDASGRTLLLDRETSFRESTLEFLSRLFMPLTESPMISISAVAFPTDHFRKLGGFKDFRRGQHIDRLAWAELAQFGDIFCIPEPLASLRVHPEQLSHSPDVDYPAALSANREMEVCFEELLDRLSKQPCSQNDPALLALVRSRFQDYCRRQRRRAMDQGLWASIATHKIRSSQDFKAALLYAQKYNVPFFSSLLYYQCLFILPSKLRTPFLDAFRQYKMKRWFS